MSSATVLDDSTSYIVLLIKLDDGRCFIVSSDKADGLASMLEATTGNPPGQAKGDAS